MSYIKSKACVIHNRLISPPPLLTPNHIHTKEMDYWVGFMADTPLARPFLLPPR